MSTWADQHVVATLLLLLPVATALLQQWLSAAGRGLRRGDVLAGVVVIVGGVDDEGRLTDLPAETLAAAQDFARGWLR